MELASTPWTVSLPDAPQIRAVIATNSWQMTTETAARHARLSVIENSLLILFCLASYPVRWHTTTSDSRLKEIPSQTWTSNQDLENSTHNANSIIRSVDRYKSMLIFKNVSSDTAGMYLCDGKYARYDGNYMPKMRKNLHITVHSATSASASITTGDPIQILQTGFDIIQLWPKRSLSSWQETVDVVFVYSIPTNASLALSVQVPAHISGAPSKSRRIDVIAPNQTSDVHFGSEKSTLSIETKMITLNTYITSLKFNRIEFAEGDYQLLISAGLENGTVIDRVEQFRLLNGLEYYTADTKLINQTAYSVMLDHGDWYNIRTLALFHEPLAAVKSKLTAWELSPVTEKYAQRILLPNEAEAICGIVAFNTVKNDGEVDIEIIVRATRPCKLKVTVTEMETNRTLQTSLLFLSITADRGTESRSKVISVPGSINDEASVTANDSFTLKCILPSNNYQAASWCLRHWPAGSISRFDGSGERSQQQCSEVPSLDISVSSYTKFQSLWQLETTFDLRFDWSQLYYFTFWESPRNHTVGKYFQFHLPQDFEFMDPIKNATDAQTLSTNGTLTLSCALNGRSRSDSIRTWNLSIASAKAEKASIMPFITDLRDKTTLDVPKVEIYECKAIYECSANQLGENGRKFIVSDKDSPYLPSAIRCCTLYFLIPLLLFGLLLCSLWYKRTKSLFKKLAQEFTNSQKRLLDHTACSNDPHSIPYNRQSEIDRNSFNVKANLLGQGEFGSVYQGEFVFRDGSTLPVAVKIPKNDWNTELFRALLDEIKIMSYIRPHANVLQLIGACTADLEKRKLFVLVELCEMGSLKDYLLNNRLSFQGSVVNRARQFIGASGAVEKLLKFAYQIANGMEHLAAANIIHRDLALRNLLLGHNEIIKISDFGMSRQREEYKKRIRANTKLPMRWMAIESLTDGIYTWKSDVWSLGIVLWEIFSCGKKPYPDIPNDEDLRRFLKQKEDNRMRPPTIACKDIYQLMLSCWKANPDDRPSFSQCRGIISGILERKSPVVHQVMLISLSDATRNMFMHANQFIQNTPLLPSTEEGNVVKVQLANKETIQTELVPLMSESGEVTTPTSVYSTDTRRDMQRLLEECAFAASSTDYIVDTPIIREEV